MQFCFDFGQNLKGREYVQNKLSLPWMESESAGAVVTSVEFDDWNATVTTLSLENKNV